MVTQQELEQRLADIRQQRDVQKADLDERREILARTGDRDDVRLFARERSEILNEFAAKIRVLEQNIERLRQGQVSEEQAQQLVQQETQAGIERVEQREAVSRRVDELIVSLRQRGASQEEIRQQVTDVQRGRRVIVTVDGETGAVTREELADIQRSEREGRTDIIETRAAIRIRGPVQPTGVISAPPDRGVFGERLAAIERARRLRLEGGALTVEERLLSSPVGGLLSPFLAVGELGERFIRSPIQTSRQFAGGIREIGGRVFTSEPILPDVGTRIAQDPAFFSGQFIGEIAFFKGSSIALRQVSRVGEVGKVGVARATGKFRPVVTEGDLRKIVNVARETGETFDIPLAGSFRETAESLKAQVQLAGQQVDAISGARDLFGIIRKRTITVDKPAPPGVPLERAFFADPRGRLRTSRLGLDGQDTAGLLDIVSGEFAFRRSKPQAILIERTLVQQFPRELRDIRKALEVGKALTPKQQQRLLKFQLTPTGQFKPIGFISKESEIVLAPGEIIKRQGTAAVSFIEGRAVPIIRAGIVRDPEAAARIARTTTPRALERELARATGISTQAIETRPFLSPSATLLTISRRISPSPKITGVIRPETSARVTQASRQVPPSRPIRSPPPSSPPTVRRSPGSSISTASPIRRTGSSPISPSPSPRPSPRPSPSPISRGVSTPIRARTRPREPPRPPIRFPLPELRFRERPVRRRKMRRGQFGFIFTPGFAAKELGITAAVSPANLDKFLRTETRRIGIRRIPVIR